MSNLLNIEVKVGNGQQSTNFNVPSDWSLASQTTLQRVALSGVCNADAFLNTLPSSPTGPSVIVIEIDTNTCSE